jgi:hypothetical protein
VRFSVTPDSIDRVIVSDAISFFMPIQLVIRPEFTIVRVVVIVVSALVIEAVKSILIEVRRLLCKVSVVVKLLVLVIAILPVTSCLLLMWVSVVLLFRLLPVKRSALLFGPKHLVIGILRVHHRRLGFRESEK